MKNKAAVLLGLTILASAGLKAAYRYPTNSSLGYRGVVFANGNNLNGPGQEIFVDFGSVGIWAYDNVWHQLSGVNPDWIIGAMLGNFTDDNLVGGFGALGLWIWQYNDYPGTWTQLSGIAPKWGFSCDDNADGLDELYVDFGLAYGVWRYYHAQAAWTQISAIEPTNGRRAYRWNTGFAQAILSFPTYGVWEVNWMSGTPQYTQLSAVVTAEDDHPAGKYLGGAAQDLVIDFGAVGLWLLQNGSYTQWFEITPLSVNRLRTIQFSGQDKLLLDFDADSGLYWWDGLGFTAGNIRRIIGTDPDVGFCERLETNGAAEPGGDQEVAVDLGANGLWIYDHTDASWTQISGINPVFMVVGDSWNDGYESTLAVDFGAVGLWRYHAVDKTWDQLSALSPDEQLN